MRDGKTTKSGVCSVLLGVAGLITQAVFYFDGDAKTVFDVNAVGAAISVIVAGVGLIFAKDAKKSQEP